MTAQARNDRKEGFLEKTAIAEAIGERIRQLKETELRRLDNAANDATRFSRETEEALNTFIQESTSGGKRSAEDVPENLQWRLKELQQLAQSTAEAKAVASRASAAGWKELRDLEQQLSDLDLCPSIEDLLYNRKAIAEAEQTVFSLKTAIDQQEALVAKAEAEVFLPENLSLCREDLMAEAALGVSVDKDLKALDAKIEEQKKLHAKSRAKADESIRPAQQAIAGIQRKLAEATAAAAALQKGRAFLVNHYFIGEAERVGREYIRQANELRSSFIRLVGINEIIKGDRESILGAEVSLFRIPAFNLKAFDGEESGMRKKHLFAVTAEMLLDAGRARDAEIERLRAQGVE